MNYKKIISTEFFFLALIPFIYITTWDKLFFSTLLSIIAVIFVLYLFHKKLDILYFSLGLLFGSIGEISVVYFGVWEYTKPLFLGIPLWLSLFWGYAFLIINRFMEKVIIFDTKIKKKKYPIILLIIIYPFLILIPSFIENNLLIFIGLSFIFILLLLTHNKKDIFFVLFFSIFGILLEILCVYYGIWKYFNPDIFGIPLWLPVLYADFSLFIRKTVNNIFLLSGNKNR